MAWQPIHTAPRDGKRIHARDADGVERVTWFDFGVWVYVGWRENDDRDEYETEEWWEPTEWDANRTPAKNRAARAVREGVRWHR
jgi:hypothetical protein